MSRFDLLNSLSVIGVGQVKELSCSEELGDAEMVVIDKGRTVKKAPRDQGVVWVSGVTRGPSVNGKVTVKGLVFPWSPTGS